MKTYNAKKILFLFCLFIFTESNMFALSPYQFFRTSSNARAAALAGAYTATQNDPAALFFNPASVYTNSDRDLSFTFLKNVMDVNSGNAAIVLEDNTFEDGKLAFSLHYTNYGTFEYMNSDGSNGNGTFGANNFFAGVTYSNALDSNFSYGVSTKIAYFSLEKSSSTLLAFDAGLLYKLKGGRTTLGLSLLNVGTELSKLGDMKESLPTDLRFGASFLPKGLPLQLNVSLNRLADPDRSFSQRLRAFSIGGEIYLGKVLNVRLGYDNDIRNSPNISSELVNFNKGMSGFSAGAGIKLTNYNLDYAMNIYGSSATLHRFSLSMNY